MSAISQGSQSVVRPRLRAGILGRGRAALKLLLSDVLSDVGLEFDEADEGREIDLLLALVTQQDVDHVLSAVARQSPEIPTIAILSVGDDRLAKRAIDCGAQACYALDTSLDLLKFLLLAVAVDTSRPVAINRAEAPVLTPSFRLGPQARALLDELKESGGEYPGHSVGRDAELRIERAIQSDASVRSIHRLSRTPYQFGVQARLEVTLMRLSADQIDQLERAIQADLAAESKKA